MKYSVNISQIALAFSGLLSELLIQLKKKKLQENFLFLIPNFFIPVHPANSQNQQNQGGILIFTYWHLKKIMQN